MAIRNNRRHFIILIVAVMCLGLLLIGVATQWKKPTPKPVFIGYYGEQPKLEINLMSESDSDVDISGILNAAKNFFQNWDGKKEDFWLEPVEITERPNVWWIIYQEKERLFVLNGEQLVETSVPGGITIEVSKSDMSCRGVPSM